MCSTETAVVLDARAVLKSSSVTEGRRAQHRFGGPRDDARLRGTSARSRFAPLGIGSNICLHYVPVAWRRHRPSKARGPDGKGPGQGLRETHTAINSSRLGATAETREVGEGREFPYGRAGGACVR